MSLVISQTVTDVWDTPGKGDRLRAQALLGTPLTLTDERDDWRFVHLPDYNGWVEAGAIANGPEPSDWTIVVTQPVVELPTGQRLLAGTRLFVVPAADGKALIAIPNNGTVPPVGPGMRLYGAPSSMGGGYAVRTALQFMGVPYRWGGLTLGGLDCSGLVQLAWDIAGVHLPRNCRQQWDKLTETVSLDDWEAGDLVFFGDNGTPDHVGLVMEKNVYLHSVDRGQQRGGVQVASFTPGKRYLGTRRVTAMERFGCR